MAAETMSPALRRYVEETRARWAAEYKPSESGRLVQFADTLLGKRAPEMADPRQMNGVPSKFWFPGLAAKPWHDVKDYPWVKIVEDGYPVIRAELMAALARQSEIRAAQEGRPEFKHAGWREFNLKRYEDCAWFNKTPSDEDTSDAQRQCPRTMEILDRIPNFASCSFSKLEPKGHIEPHVSDFNAKVTCHLAIDIPEGVWIEVAGERRGWTEGKVFIFDDTFPHEVKHEGSRPRIVMLFDAWHYELTPLERDELWRLTRGAAELGLGMKPVTHHPVEKKKKA